MFFLGHLGIGSKVVSPWTEGLSRRWVFLSAILPDLIDKPLYYALVLATGKRGAELGLISGTQTVAHTAIFLSFFAGVAVLRKSRLFAALALGIVSHLLLDNLFDHFVYGKDGALIALFFPFLGSRFPVMPFDTLKAHLGTVWTSSILTAEVIGLAILLWDGWKLHYQSEILSFFKARRIRTRQLKKARALRKQKLELKNSSAIPACSQNDKDA